jgi:hypothetical protein
MGSVVIPGLESMLLGAISLEDMDLRRPLYGAGICYYTEL